jgi:hypothetical protein
MRQARRRRLGRAIEQLLELAASYHVSALAIPSLVRPHRPSTLQNQRHMEQTGKWSRLIAVQVGTWQMAHTKSCEPLTRGAKRCRVMCAPRLMFPGTLGEVANFVNELVER